MSWIPPRLSAEERKREIDYQIRREARDLRDRLAEAAMTAAIAVDPSFFQSPASIEKAGEQFYALADSMIRARG